MLLYFFFFSSSFNSCLGNAGNPLAFPNNPVIEKANHLVRLLIVCRLTPLGPQIANDESPFPTKPKTPAWKPNMGVGRNNKKISSYPVLISEDKARQGSFLLILSPSISTPHVASVRFQVGESLCLGRVIDSPAYKMSTSGKEDPWEMWVKSNMEMGNSRPQMHVNQVKVRAVCLL